MKKILFHTGRHLTFFSVNSALVSIFTSTVCLLDSEKILQQKSFQVIDRLLKNIYIRVIFN